MTGGAPRLFLGLVAMKVTQTARRLTKREKVKEAESELKNDGLNI